VWVLSETLLAGFWLLKETLQRGDSPRAPQDVRVFFSVIMIFRNVRSYRQSAWLPAKHRAGQLVVTELKLGMCQRSELPVADFLPFCACSNTDLRQTDLLTTS
jgi:hypothetical protein